MAAMSVDSIAVMASCVRYHACNAPLCPLDQGLRERKMLPGEPLCLLLREWMKPGGYERLAGTLPGWQMEMLRQTHAHLSASPGPARKALKRASKQGSKVEIGRAMKEASQLGRLP